MNIHVQSHKTDIYKESVINMGTKLYNKMPPGYTKEMDNYKKELKSFLLYHALYSVDECLFVIYKSLIFHLASKYTYFISGFPFTILC
jgi:hypothetical protein